LASIQGKAQAPVSHLSNLTDEELRASVPLVPHVNANSRYLTNEPGGTESNYVSLKDFWNSGLTAKARQQEYTKRHLAASGKQDDADALAAMTVFVPVYENLQWYTTQKALLARNAPGQAKGWLPTPNSTAPAGRDYFVSRYVEPPEWCIDRSMSLGPVGGGTIGKGVLGGERKVQTFFGELDWVAAPERVGRDVRYQGHRVPSWSGSDKSGRKTPQRMSGGVGPGTSKSSGLGMSLGRFG